MHPDQKIFSLRFFKRFLDFNVHHLGKSMKKRYCIWFLSGTGWVKGTLPNGTTLSADPMTTQVGSLDGAQRNPGIDGVADRFPPPSPALLPGVFFCLFRVGL